MAYATLQPMGQILGSRSKLGQMNWITATYFIGFFLELLNGTLVDTSALEDQVSGGGTLTRVDVANNDGVNM